ncbi:hypothetical protein [Bradymonas sediminis]|uniref:Uncharacterized protein n=1 Tax=Bradymonas sediminis TaxID=1548548 RepID=A0A2Z4FPV8_9DELT|nr:hypothetical protein [Bradymonas sediminis]AWV90932.1 hypothetical protein DN745_17015 [Bradymonas sediminis]
MKFFYEEFAKTAGILPEDVAVYGAIFGMLLVVIGLILLPKLLAALRMPDGGELRLSPTLAEDVLDFDLSEIYQRSLALDAQLFNAKHDLSQGVITTLSGADARPQVGATGSTLGRALRKWAVRAQAERFARRAGRARPPQKNEPPAAEARLERMNQVLDEALSLDATSSDIYQVLDELTCEVETARRQMDARAAGDDIARGPAGAD